MAVKFGVFVNGDHSKLLTLYWLHVSKRPRTVCNLSHPNKITMSTPPFFNRYCVHNKHISYVYQHCVVYMIGAFITHVDLGENIYAHQQHV